MLNHMNPLVPNAIKLRILNTEIIENNMYKIRFLSEFIRFRNPIILLT
jgi:hypothetical protein